MLIKKKTNKNTTQHNTNNKIHLIGIGFQFRDLVHYCLGWKYGSMQEDMGTEKDLKVLHREALAAGGDNEPLGFAGASETSSLSPVTYFLQQCHTRSNKATFTNSGTPYGLMGSIFTQTTTCGIAES